MAESKYVRRMKVKLADRTYRYNESLKRGKHHGKGLRKPGSQNPRKAG